MPNAASLTKILGERLRAPTDAVEDVEEGAQSQVRFNDAESSGVFVVSYPNGFVNSVLFDKGPKFTHFLVHVVVEVKIVQLCQS